MLGTQTRQSIARLAASVLSVRPLVGALDEPVRVVPMAGGTVSTQDYPMGRWKALDRLLRRVATLTGVTGLTLTRPTAFDDLHVFERVVSRRLGLLDVLAAGATVPVDRLGEVDEVVAAILADSFDVFSHKEIIPSFDGVPLQVHVAGQGPEAVVLVPACGMPAVLAESWVRHFARDRRVLTWESRGLFGAAGQHDEFRVDVDAQAADLFAVMDHHGVAAAHVVGLCGGAVIALAAAAARPDRVTSLSLWHGDYGFADGRPETKHQQGLMDMMSAAATSRGAAAAVHAAFCRVTLTDAPPDVAHLVLYPYANAGLLYRYCRLNREIALTDVQPYLDRVRQSVLVATSRDDDVCHPDGSARVAAGLLDARLRVAEHGDHISLFDADESVLATAREFMTESMERV